LFLRVYFPFWYLHLLVIAQSQKYSFSIQTSIIFTLAIPARNLMCMCMCTLKRRRFLLSVGFPRLIHFYSHENQPYLFSAVTSQQQQDFPKGNGFIFHGWTLCTHTKSLLIWGE
jgi:hypothetical protein